MDKRTLKTSRFLLDDSWCCIEYEQDKVLEVREKSDLVPEDDCERCGSTLIVGERCTARYSDGDIYVAYMIYEADKKEQCIKFKLDEERKRKIVKAKGKKNTQNVKPVAKDKKRKGNDNQEITKKKRKLQETPKEEQLQEKCTNNLTQANTTSTTRKKEIKELEKQQTLAREKSAQQLAYSMFSTIKKHDTFSTACVSVSLNGNQSQPLNNKKSQPPSNEENSEQPPINDENSKQPTLNDENSGQPPLNDENSGQPPLNDKNSGQPPLNDENSGQPPLNDENSGQPPLNDENSEQPPLNDENSGQPPLNDENSKQPPLNDENSGQSPLNDENSGQPPLNDENSGQPPLLNGTKSESWPMNGNQLPYLHVSDQSTPSGYGDFYNAPNVNIPFQPIPQGHGFYNHFQHGLYSADQPKNVFSQAHMTQHQQHQSVFQTPPIYPQLNYAPNYPYFNHSTRSPFTTNTMPGDNACNTSKYPNNVGNLMSSSFNLLENDTISRSVTENVSSETSDEDVDNALYVACPIPQPPDNDKLKPQPPACSNQCLDCIKKDKEIADLKMRLYKLGPSEGEIVKKNKKYKPKTRPETKTSDYMIVPEDSAPPAGFQLLAPKATIAVRPLWLDETVALVGQNRERQNKKAIKKGKTLKSNFNSEITKKLMDGFFDPEELAIAGGTGAFKGNAIFESLKLYAHHCLSVDTATLNVYWREKMSSSCQTLKRRRESDIKDLN